MERFELRKNFNIASTIINDNIKVSTAAIFYDEIFGERYQLETFIFKKEGRSMMKIHEVYENQTGIDYCISFHNKIVALIKTKIK